MLEGVIIAKHYPLVNSDARVPFERRLLSNIPMQEVRETRRSNMEALAREHGSLKALAELVDTNERYLSQIRNRTGHMGNALARKFERKLAPERPVGWMDHPLTQATQETRRPQTPKAGDVLSDVLNMDPDEQAKLFESLKAIGQTKTKEAITRVLLSTQNIFGGLKVRDGASPPEKADGGLKVVEGTEPPKKTGEEGKERSKK